MSAINSIFSVRGEHYVLRSITKKAIHLAGIVSTINRADTIDAFVEFALQNSDRTIGAMTDVLNNILKKLSSVAGYLQGEPPQNRNILKRMVRTVMPFLGDIPGEPLKDKKQREHDMDLVTNVINCVAEAQQTIKNQANIPPQRPSTSDGNPLLPDGVHSSVPSRSTRQQLPNKETATVQNMASTIVNIHNNSFRYKNNDKTVVRIANDLNTQAGRIGKNLTIKAIQTAANSLRMGYDAIASEIEDIALSSLTIDPDVDVNNIASLQNTDDDDELLYMDGDTGLSNSNPDQIGAAFVGMANVVDRMYPDVNIGNYDISGISDEEVEEEFRKAEMELGNLPSGRK
jgi:hypothetical protein